MKYIIALLFLLPYAAMAQTYPLHQTPTPQDYQRKRYYDNLQNSVDDVNDALRNQQSQQTIDRMRQSSQATWDAQMENARREGESEALRRFAEKERRQLEYDDSVKMAQWWVRAKAEYAAHILDSTTAARARQALLEEARKKRRTGAMRRKKQ